jgi:hypothetical protein
MFSELTQNYFLLILVLVQGNVRGACGCVAVILSLRNFPPMGYQLVLLIKLQMSVRLVIGLCNGYEGSVRAFADESQRC